MEGNLMFSQPLPSLLPFVLMLEGGHNQGACKILSMIKSTGGEILSIFRDP
jgi:hypothetical protein